MITKFEVKYAKIAFLSGYSLRGLRNIIYLKKNGTMAEMVLALV